MGFGARGNEGMIAAARWACTKLKPVVEAHSVKLYADTPTSIIVFMPEIDKVTMDGNMRLGLRPTLFQAGTEWPRLRKLYQDKRDHR
jgi:CTP synthase